MRCFILLLVIIYSVSCVPPNAHDELEVAVDLSNEVHRTILEAKDKGDIATIATYLSAEDVTERYMATEACTSIKGDEVSTRLIELLNTDPSDEIRAMAAYALGQQGDSDNLSALIHSFQAQDTSNYNSIVRSAILEAIGKCGDVATLDQISSVSTYTNNDEHLLLGQARSIYRYARRNIYSDMGTETMIGNVLDQSKPEATRTLAAQYLIRYPALDLGTSLIPLTNVLRREENVDVRMALAGTLARTGHPSVAPVVMSFLKGDPDYRVKCNIIRQLGAFDYTVYRDTLINLLNDSNEHIFNLSAELLKSVSPRQESGAFLQMARASTDEKRRPGLLAISLNSLPSRFINTRRIVCAEMASGIKATTKETVKAEYLDALALDPLNLPVIIEEGLASPSHLLRTTAINSIKDLLTNERTQRIYIRPSAMAGFREAIVSQLTSLLAEGDPGTVAAIASVVRQEECGFKEVVGLNLSLRSAMRKLSLPQDYEAMKECHITLGYLEDTTYTSDPLSYNHPIDWTLIEDLTDSSRAYIITTKGQIEVKLFKNHAPGSVANFVDLAQSNFYDGKSIHRVVPNFVIQGGCPRGDGYGSLDYTIRSELGPQYYDGAGYVGMASAGQNTEGTQWFITHSPTPHLDGNYTIFGKITSGMDVVHSIYPGDLIQDVRILKY